MRPLQKASHLARIALAFGRVERATCHEDGARPETDTDHTVMLGLVACELAPAGLDRTKIAAFALVHDLVEVYAGDAQTLTITPDGVAAKRAREDAARARLVGELGEGAWLASMLSTYEEQREPEARFVRLIDKVTPKLTHAFNGCAAAKALTDRDGFVAAHARQFRQMREEYPEFTEALNLLAASMRFAEECWSNSEAQVAPKPAVRSCHACHWSGWDPDGPYCMQPTVTEGFPHGLALSSRRLADRCPAPDHPHFEASSDPRKAGAR